MAQMSVTSDSDHKQYIFNICMVECIVAYKKEYAVIIEPLKEYSEESINLVINKVFSYFRFQRIFRKKINFFLKNENDIFFEIKYEEINEYYINFKKYLDVFSIIKTGLFKVYGILRDYPDIIIHKLKDILP